MTNFLNKMGLLAAVICMLMAAINHNVSAMLGWFVAVINIFLNVISKKNE